MHILNIKIILLFFLIQFLCSHTPSLSMKFAVFLHSFLIMWKNMSPPFILGKSIHIWHTLLYIEVLKVVYRLQVHKTCYSFSTVWCGRKWQILSFLVNFVNLTVSMAIGKILILNWAKSDLLHLELQCFVYSSVINVSLNLIYILSFGFWCKPNSHFLFNLSLVLYKHSSVLMSI